MNKVFTFAYKQMESTIEQVRIFLKEFHSKKKVYQVIFRDDRGKNVQSLLDLEMRPVDREKIIDSLKPEYYYEGPNKDTLHGGSDMWVFGVKHRKTTIYIKITMGRKDCPVICISFHKAEFEMKLPYKNEKI